MQPQPAATRGAGVAELSSGCLQGPQQVAPLRSCSQGGVAHENSQTELKESAEENKNTGKTIIR